MITPVSPATAHSFPPDLTARAETAEAEFMFAYEDGVPAPAREQLGLVTTRLGGGVVLSMAGATSRYWSKAIGFGFTEPVSTELVRQILDVYRDNQDRTATLQFAPSVQPENWAGICAEHGLRPGPPTLKLAGSIDGRPLDRTDRRTDLKVGRIGPEHAQDWAALVLNTFGMTDPGLTDMLVATLDTPAFRPFGAWDGRTLVAAANLHLQDGVASLNTGATLAGHRGRGAQSALIAARIQEAAAAGCDLLVAETGKPEAGQRNPSTDNLLRAGLSVLYTRQNWTWSAD